MENIEGIAGIEYHNMQVEHFKCTRLMYELYINQYTVLVYYMLIYVNIQFKIKSLIHVAYMSQQHKLNVHII